MATIEHDLDSSQTLQKLQSGGTTELTALFERQRQHLRAMVESRLDKRLHARVDASDIVQEAFLRATQGVRAYLEFPNVHPVVWLRLIGKHIVSETHRRHFREKRSPVRELQYQVDSSDSEPLCNKLADSMQSVGTCLAKQELVNRVLQAIQQMTPNDREILEMRHVEEMTMEEAAVALELNIETAKKRYYRALCRFRVIATEILPDA
jgi:RNA polymerase sigma-70 factor (ECF subfamily)